MTRVESPIEVRRLLGVKLLKGKRVGVFPEQRHLSTNDKNGKMTGMVLGSGLNTDQKYDEVARGKEYNQEMQDNPEFNKHEP